MFEKIKKLLKLNTFLDKQQKKNPQFDTPCINSENRQKLKIPSNFLKAKYHKTFSAVTVACYTAYMNFM